MLSDAHPGLVLDPPVRLRAAVTEAAAMCEPVGALTRDGASQAAAEFTALSLVLDPEALVPTDIASSWAQAATAATPGEI